MPVSDRSRTTEVETSDNPEYQRVAAETRLRDLIEPDDVVELKRRIDVGGDRPHT